MPRRGRPDRSVRGHLDHRAAMALQVTVKEALADSERFKWFFSQENREMHPSLQDFAIREAFGEEIPLDEWREKIDEAMGGNKYARV